MIAEADGSHAEAAGSRRELEEALAEDALEVHARRSRMLRSCGAGAAGVAFAILGSAAARSRGHRRAARPAPEVDRRDVEIGERHGVFGALVRVMRATATSTRPSSSRPTTRRGPARRRAPATTCSTRVALGGTVTGEHGIGWLKRGQLEKQWALARELHRAVKQVFDPKNLLNPGKKR